MKLLLNVTIFFVGLAGLLFVPPANSRAADKIVWKPIPQVVLRIDDQAPKIWNVYRTAKKADPLLLQIGARMLVIYIHNQEVYEIKPEQVDHKGVDLLWREADKPNKPLATSDWNVKDVGSATRILIKLTGEGRMVNIEIPHMPDLRRGIY